MRILFLAMFLIGVTAGAFVAPALHTEPSRPSYPVQGVYERVYLDYDRTSNQYWIFEDSTVTVFNDHKVPITMPYIYDESEDGRRFMYTMSQEYMVLFDESGRMQLHQKGGE